MSFRLAIDGPSASGKSTISKLIAKKLNWTHIDTGALYRSCAYAALLNNIDITNETEFDFLDNITINIEGRKIYLNGNDITDKIRTHEISDISSKISVYKKVRNYLYNLQVQLSQSGNVVMDGRDIGTVIMPDADLKIFLTASLDERAKRRSNDYSSKDINNIKNELSERDLRDITRSCSPLKKAEDAIEIDTSNLTIEQVVNKIINIIKTKENK